MDRIQPGQIVKWRTYPSALSSSEHEGEVLAFLPKDQPVPEVARPYMGGLAFVVMLARVPRAALMPAKRDRYLIRCGSGQEVMWRLPSATLVETQNLGARRAPP